MVEDKLLPMNKNELAFKSLYVKHSELFRTPMQIYDRIPVDWPYFAEEKPLVDKLMKHYPIDEFFYDVMSAHPEYNVWANRHPRYFPLAQHKLNCIKILCCLKGQCEIWFAGTKYELNAGDVCFVAPDVIHAVGIFRDDQIALNFFMKPSVLNDCFTNLLHRDDILSNFLLNVFYSSANKPAIIFRTDHDEDVLRIIDSMGDEYFDSPDEFTPHMLEAQMMLFLATLLRKHRNDISVIDLSNKTEDTHLVECIRYLYENYADTTLTEMAAKFHYSTSHLSEIIKQYTGSTFLEFTRSKKLESAWTLLTQSDLSIHDIAEKSGFHDMSHFYRSFKAKYGLTPQQCQKTYNNQPAKEN